MPEQAQSGSTRLLFPNQEMVVELAERLPPARVIRDESAPLFSIPDLTDVPYVSRRIYHPRLGWTPGLEVTPVDESPQL
jgi:hypothetical protein